MNRTLPAALAVLALLPATSARAGYRIIGPEGAEQCAEPRSQERVRAVGSICYGEDYGFSLKAPRGWAADPNPGDPDVCLMLHPRDQAWSKSPALMYPSHLHKRALPFETVVENEVKDFQAKNPDRTKPSASKLHLVIPGHAVEVRHFEGEGANSHEEVVYVDDGPTVGVMVLASSTRAAYEAALPAFKAWVRSYAPASRNEILEALIDVGEKDEAAPESKAYQPRAMQALGPAIERALVACTPPGPPPSPYDLVFEVGPQGSVDEVMVTETSEVARCAKEKLGGLSVPPPPFEPYHLHVRIETRN